MTPQERIEHCYNKGYRISDDGKIISPKGKELKGHCSKGYLKLALRKGNKIYTISVHRLVAFQKFGQDLFVKGIEVRHLNGNSLDNSKENILLGTHSENMLDISPEVRLEKALNATARCRKYNKELVKEYFKLHGFKKAMDHFSITSKGTMSYIINH